MVLSLAYTDISELKSTGIEKKKKGFDIYKHYEKIKNGGAWGRDKGKKRKLQQKRGKRSKKGTFYINSNNFVYAYFV